MQYYTFKLDEESKDLCTIATLFGKFKYNWLPMGLTCSPDFDQEVMENIFHDVEDAEVYIDDIGVFSNSWEEHMALLCRILTLLQDNGFTVNPLKCEWAVSETGWLGYWLTPMGLKIWKKNWCWASNAASNKPQTITCCCRSGQLSQRDVAYGSHKKGVKAPPFKWTPEMQHAFEEKKAPMAAEILCAYPDHNKPFKIYTDPSNY
jgi:hypothetical protein